MTATILLVLLLALGWLANRFDSAPRPAPDRHPEFPRLEFTRRDPDFFTSNPPHAPRAPKDRPARGEWKSQKVQV